MSFPVPPGVGKRPCVLIDIDGTICDAQKKKFDAYVSCLEFINEHFREELSEPMDIDFLWNIARAQFAVFSGNLKNDNDIRFSLALGFCGITRRNIAPVLPELDRCYWEGLEGFQVYPGAGELFDYLLLKGYDYHLFSDTSAKEAEFKIQRFPKGFLPGDPRIIVTDHSYNEDERILALGMDKVAETYRFLKENWKMVAMVGDSDFFDIIPAQEAGLLAFKVKDGNIGATLENVKKSL